MVKVDKIILVVPKQGINVPGIRDPSQAIYEKTVNFVELRIQHNHFAKEIS